MAWIEKLHQARAELAERGADPFRQKLEAAVRGKEAISTAALLDLLDVPKTTGNARRVGKTMRSLGYVPIKSRKLIPGGFRDTVARGWARPVRQSGTQSNPSQGEKVGSPHIHIAAR
jgi:hypothetical protein